MTTLGSSAVAIAMQQQAIAGYARAGPTPRPTARTFTVWNGTTINPTHQAMSDIAAAVWRLVPPGFAEDEVEWLVKAGEAGTYQAVWDPHPLAISGPDKLQSLYNQGGELGVIVSPYVVVRGNPEWRSAEVAQIRALAMVGGRVVLNLEPGSQYAHSSICTPGGAERYMKDLDLPAAELELCAIPREEQVRQLGGPETLSVWLSMVGTASWEMYGIVAPSSLRVDVATPYLHETFPGIPPEQCLPLVQRPEIGTWADTDYAAAGLQAWHLDGAI